MLHVHHNTSKSPAESRTLAGGNCRLSCEEKSVDFIEGEKDIEIIGWDLSLCRASDWCPISSFPMSRPVSLPSKLHDHDQTDIVTEWLFVRRVCARWGGWIDSGVDLGTLVVRPCPPCDTLRIDLLRRLRTISHIGEHRGRAA